MRKYHAKTIITPRLKIRMPRISDAHNMFKNWASDSEVTKYISWDPHPSVDVSEMILSMWINLDKSDKSIEWLIVHRITKEAIGSINIYNIDHADKKCEIGFCLSRKFWNQGLMTEALFYTLKYVFSLGIKEVWGRCVSENVASKKVMMKNHMMYSHTITGHNHALIDYYVVKYLDWKEKI